MEKKDIQMKNNTSNLSCILPPALYVSSKYKIRHGYAVNGVHIEKKRKVTGYRIQYLTQNLLFQCRSCNGMIHQNEVYGYHVGVLHAPFLCKKCINLPKTFTVWEVKIKLLRRSKRNPSGIRNEIIVCSNTQFARYMKRICRHYPGSTAQYIYCHEYEQEENPTKKAVCLSQLYDILWDYLAMVIL